MGEVYNVHEETLTAIADKIRERKYIDTKMTPAEMVDEIDEMGYPLGVDEDKNYYCADGWVRPEGYPNLDAIDISDMDGVYLTFDITKTPGYAWIGIYGERLLNFPIYIERGHLNENNEFVVEEQHSIGNKAFFRQDLDEADGDVQLWRVWSEGHLNRVAFSPNTGTSAQNFVNQLCPCVERRGRLPYCTNISSSADNRYNYVTWGTRWLMRDDVQDMTALTNMSSAYENCYELQEVKFDGWDTSNLTTMVRAFCQCHKLRHIPLDKLVTPKVNSLANCFQYCYSLEEADISHFDIDDVNNMGCLFDGCRNIRHIKMPVNGGIGKLATATYLFSHCNSLEEMPENYEKLDVRNVTSFSYAFQQCRKLKHIDLSMWEVEKVTTLTQMFTNCVELITADLSGWNVSGVTAANSMFEACVSLCEVNLDGWYLNKIENISYFHRDNRCLKHSDILARINWESVTRIDNMFINCNALQTVEISGCDVENQITSCSSLFSNCWSLRSVHMPGMHFTVPVTMDSIFTECHSLDDLDVSGWHIEALRAISSLFSGCYMLKEVDLTDWVIDDGNLTVKNTVNSMFTGMRSCKVIKAPLPITVTNGSMSYLFDSTVCEYIDISGMNLRGSTNSNLPSMAHCPIVDFYPPLLPAVSVKCDNCTRLSRESLVRLFKALPAVTSTKTITIGQTNRLKLTDADKAIATGKGWAIA